ncbi:hypothetical protein L596_024607 [Steinernema carpocapsae]|uniref:Peptidase S1 domain-containing protein n=1 Tax=Steinernema carpocapsae TaxID=34508 RepID=A0A4U5M568_STECR|nr:hypothetical protein L596_024607 [Steinernema carpocapsae]
MIKTEPASTPPLSPLSFVHLSDANPLRPLHPPRRVLWCPSPMLRGAPRRADLLRTRPLSSTPRSLTTNLKTAAAERQRTGGDSGGPIQVYSNGQLYQPAGLKSFGSAVPQYVQHNQEQYPSVFKRLASYCQFMTQYARGAYRSGSVGGGGGGSPGGPGGPPEDVAAEEAAADSEEAAATLLLPFPRL